MVTQNIDATPSNTELLDFDELMQRGTNHTRQLRAHALWSAAKLERQQGNRELADRLKAADNRLVHKNFQVNNPPERKLAALRAAANSATAFLAYAPFRDRGFSDRTINALVAGGIDAPERLLFLTGGRVEADPRHRAGIDGRDQALPRAFSSDPCRGQPGWLEKPSSTSTSRPRRSP